MNLRHQKMIEDAAANLIAVADDASISLVDVIANMERYIVEETKVSNAAVTSVPVGRRGYTLQAGRLVEV